MNELIIPVLGIVFVIGVPVIAWATRFALRPLLKDLAEALGAGTRQRDELAELAARVAQLERDGQDRDVRVDELVEAERFRRRLEEDVDG